MAGTALSFPDAVLAMGIQPQMPWRYADYRYCRRVTHSATICHRVCILKLNLIRRCLGIRQYELNLLSSICGCYSTKMWCPWDWNESQDQEQSTLYQSPLHLFLLSCCLWIYISCASLTGEFGFVLWWSIKHDHWTIPRDWTPHRLPVEKASEWNQVHASWQNL